MKIAHSKKNYKVYFLLLGVIIVWGSIIYRTIGYFTNDNSTAISQTFTSDLPTKIASNTNGLKKETKLDYLELKRDPFSLTVRRDNSTLKRKAKIIKNNTPALPKIKYQIKGIIISGKRKLVIFEDITDNKILFLRKGQAYKGIIIRNIESTTVTLLSYKKIIKITPE